VHPGYAGHGGDDRWPDGAGHDVEEILADYPYWEREDILQALCYAAWRTEEREVELARA